MNDFPARIRLPGPVWRALLGHIQSCLPEESCGLLGGTGEQVSLFIPIENELHSPVRFRMEPAAQLSALLVLEGQGLELLAIFHSHPSGPNHPSVTDRAEFAYPGVLSLILSPASGPAGWQARAFAIEGVLSEQSPVREVPVEIIDASSPASGVARNPPEEKGLT